MILSMCMQGAGGTSSYKCEIQENLPVRSEESCTICRLGSWKWQTSLAGDAADFFESDCIGMSEWESELRYVFSLDVVVGLDTIW